MRCGRRAQMTLSPCHSIEPRKDALDSDFWFCEQHQGLIISSVYFTTLLQRLSSVLRKLLLFIDPEAQVPLPLRIIASQNFVLKAVLSPVYWASVFTVAICHLTWSYTSVFPWHVLFCSFRSQLICFSFTYKTCKGSCSAPKSFLHMSSYREWD